MFIHGQAATTEIEKCSRMKNAKDLPVISLFSGAGGLDIGFRNAGFRVAVAVEQDTACCDTLRANVPGLPILCRNIVGVRGDEILRAAGLLVGEAALVIGGPPCQSFSIAGMRQGLNDPRGKLLFEFVRIVRETLPKGFVLENVKGLSSWDRGRALALLIDALSEPIAFNGQEYRYRVAPPRVINAVDYGVPQLRERLFVVGNRMGRGYEYPAASAEPRRTTWDAVGNLPEPTQPSEQARRVARCIKDRIKKHGY